MTAPISARQDLAGAIDFIASIVLTQAAKIDELEKRVGVKDSYTLKDLAARYSCSVSALSANPWHVPNFGRADFGSSPKRWYQATVEAWEMVKEDDRRAQWELMLSDKKREALVVAK